MGERRNMCNLASFDQTLRDRNVNGLSNGSKLDKEIWQEFAGRTERKNYWGRVL